MGPVFGNDQDSHPGVGAPDASDAEPQPQTTHGLLNQIVDEVLDHLTAWLFYPEGNKVFVRSLAGATAAIPNGIIVDDGVPF
jgi:hypothetical protein